VLKGENAEATEVEPSETATAIVFGNFSLCIKAQSSGIKAIISSDFE
jgi:hypothetical protein